MADQLASLIDASKLPSHIAVIMDGNGRWAKQNGQPRIFGHHNGVKAVREVTEACAELGVPWLTLYAFSTENWKRPAMEVSGLMGLLVETVKNEMLTLLKNDIRLHTIGDISKLPNSTRLALEDAIQQTANNKRMTLTLALNYSARWEILDAVNKLVKTHAHQTVSESDFTEAMSGAGIPDPELLIRTSGEKRISNFLLWQCAYTELYFTETLWPDFRKQHLYEAILNFQQRERRFGKISEQLI
ncbi:MAG: isoprenyl transferase [Saprospiraceae bacterium]|nr:isoprenyl transferase [Saprospiraceae bacterium]MBK9630389.1 isoprenyl transferase [Saprospiraceae bacterium]